MERIENERGYGNTSVRDMGVTLVSCAAEDLACLTPADVDVGREGGRGPIELSARGRRGRGVFLSTASPSCASCHSLAEAGASSDAGPDLDRLRPGEAQIATAVTQGVGVMPSMRESLTEGQIGDVAAYVREVTRGR